MRIVTSRLPGSYDPRPSSSQAPWTVTGGRQLRRAGNASTNRSHVATMSARRSSGEAPVILSSGTRAVLGGIARTNRSRRAGNRLTAARGYRYGNVPAGDGCHGERAPHPAGALADGPDP